MFERFTDRARKVMALANQEAQRFNHNYIGTEHLLLGLVREGEAGEFFMPVGVIPMRWIIQSPGGTSQVSVPSEASWLVRSRTSETGTTSFLESGSAWVGQR